MPANPNAFVTLFPVTWAPNNTDYLEQLHADRWREQLHIEQPDPDHIPDESRSYPIQFGSPPHPNPATLTVDPRLDHLEDLTETGKEPIEPGEAALLEQHETVWRVTVDVTSPTDRDDDEAPPPHAGATDSAARMLRLMATFTEAGSAGAFVPAIQQLHGSEFVRTQAAKCPPPDVDADDPHAMVQALVNLFVGARDDTVDADEIDDEQSDRDSPPWLMTRGLTSFGLPELETPVDSGFNAAYFRLLDVASGMIMQEAPYPSGAQLQLGPESFVLREGPRGPQDEVVPTSGTFGTFSILPDS